jgi:ectoine hydroxylase-related dioxygenase (phytanoyl-CoA dioxygenase family)
MKAGILHVQPPPEVMSGLLAIRLHLDESGVDNGPLRVIAGSHRKGRLSAEQIGNWNKEASVTCIVSKGVALAQASYARNGLCPARRFGGTCPAAPR